jgi:hypothetical protein
MIDHPRFKEALERGLEAFYKKVKDRSRPDGGYYMDGNREEKVREAISTAFEHYFDECLPGRYRAHDWLVDASEHHPLADADGKIRQCRRCCTIKGEPGDDTCPL